MNVAGVVISHNEAQHIERCLQSLSFCREIIVVDAHSTDGTDKIASKYATHFEQRPWVGFAEQKNHANQLATMDWILSVDADEEVSVDLRKEIENVLSNNGGFIAYSLPRKTFYAGQWIRYGGWYPNRTVRLFDRQYGEWASLPLHEYWKASGPIGKLHSDLLHFSFTNIADQVDRNNKYSSLGSQLLAQQKRGFSVLKMVTKPIGKFIESFIIKKGFLDGHLGFIIAVSASYSVFLKWAKLWELNRREAE